MAEKNKKYRVFWFFVKLQIVFLVLVSAAVAFYFFGGYAEEVGKLKQEAEKLVRTSTSETFRANETSIVYASDKSVISTLKGEKETYYLEYSQIPSNAVAAIISIEDKKFSRHNGVDYKALLRAVKAVVTSGGAVQGGSTITMQLARNTFLTQEKKWQRKVEEIFIAWNLEKKYSKNQIMEFYLNNIYFGSGYYGIQSASRGYFNRDVNELSLSQTAFLCAVPNNPSLYDPVKNKAKTIARRDRILKNMLEDGKILQSDYDKAVTENIVLERPESIAKNDYVETYAYFCAARALMENEDFRFHYYFESKEEKAAYDRAYEKLYSECQKKLYTGGYRIYTSFDLELQKELQEAVNGTLTDFTEVNEEGVFTLQASAVCIDNNDGYVKAIVGGRQQDFSGYTLNRAYQSFRQPGSSIKPLNVYTPSFEQNYTPESIVVDEPIEDGPKNSNGTYQGKVTLRRAVESSINTVAWKLYNELTPEKGLSYLKEMNFSRLDKEDYRFATALGGFTNGVSALEMASGYAALENDGKYRKPTCIVRILDASGAEIYASEQEEKIIYKQNAARMMSDVLMGVMERGTGKFLGLGNMPSAGKTGTTNDNKDGWFLGYTRYYTTGVWVGYDMPKKMNDLMGSTYPGKIWQQFMLKAHEGLGPMDFLPYAKVPDPNAGRHEEEGRTDGEAIVDDENGSPEENGNGEETPPENEGSVTPPEENGGTVAPPENEGSVTPPEENGGTVVPPGNEGSATLPENEGSATPPEENGGIVTPPENEGSATQSENEGSATPPEENGGTVVPPGNDSGTLPEENGRTVVPPGNDSGTLPEENRGL